ncbi:D-alanine--D-alanine ligase family protein [Caldilinea sp.]|uniref:D-alanine--D-alanine ligase family protein n=1 Tax=Caldilinea sp. TaxID=2293560 RepID=UPI0021DD94F7|nr:D-alanine--D-alanine ligase family protein [Caldilinea sp.]GIV68629.1 MAG: D-alanine--D-alanine ligase [Caldilinea sp.]
MTTTQRRRYRVGVLFGGRSGEHEVSLASAKNVMEALRQAGHEVVPIGITREGRWLPQPDAWLQLTAEAQERTVGRHLLGQERAGELVPRAWQLSEQPLPAIDVIFPVLHGPYGEDGTVQGLLEMANVPYVGSGVLGSALGMDKAVARKLFAHHGLPQVRHCVVQRHRWRAAPDEVIAEVEATLAYPLFVKPANMGSSVGVSKARSRRQLQDALDYAARYDRKMLVEEAVPHAREIEVSVLGNHEPVASIAGEIIPANEFYDYNAKYENEGSQLLIPAPIDAALMEQVRSYAVRAFQALECEGLARVDFLMNGETQELFVNEINTMPGFTRISMYPKLWEASGVAYPELVHRLLELALERHQERQEFSTVR